MVFVVYLSIKLEEHKLLLVLTCSKKIDKEFTLCQFYEYKNF